MHVPYVPIVLYSRIGKAISMRELEISLENRLKEEQRRAEQVTLNSIMSIANTIDAKDRYTQGHSVRVAKCSVEIAKQLGWTQEEQQNLYYVALLHDIGKIGIPDSILNKPSKLTEEEFAIVKQHPVTGSQILKDIKTIENVRDGALFHHEWYDGSGYPFGLEGEDIPIYGRIIGIADAYDAMTSQRVYHANRTREQVLEEFTVNRGKQFDPELADLFIHMLQDGFTVPSVDVKPSMDIMGESRELLNKVLKTYAQDAKNRNALDFLTGIYTRDYAETKIGELLGNGKNGALFMMDVDNFKGINDKHGHIVGDRTLQLLASVLRDHAGEQDIACRLGGDEFVVFFTDITERETLCQKAESMIKMYQERFQELGIHAHSSISIGISISPYHGMDFESLYRNADKALYYIKNNGKSSYHFFSKHREEQYNQNSHADLDNIRRMIEGNMDVTRGAYNVAYDKFKNIYDFLSRCVERKQQQVQTALLSLHLRDETLEGGEIPEKAMDALEAAVISSLRTVDVGSRYSDSQYIVILLDAHINTVSIVMERVRLKFYEMYQEGDLILTYDAQTMRPMWSIIEEQKESGLKKP